MFDPSPYPLGFDISHNNGPISWGAVDAKYKFVCVKKSEGVAFLDPRWEQNSTSVQSSGRLLVAYHFMDPQADATAQANWFLDNLNLADADRCALDIEGTAWGNVPQDARPLKVTHFSQVVKATTGKNPILYYSRGEMTGYMDMDQFADWDHWIADLSDDSVECLIRQFSFTGTVEGVGSGVDLDAWVGTFPSANLNPSNSV